MNSKIALAVMEKARRVFEREDTFLSFPLNPVPFSKSQLGAIANGDLTSPALADFSLQVNMIPGGIVWPPSEERYLWNIYHELKAVKLAKSSRSTQEENDYQTALKYLVRVNPDGLREDTPAVKAYNQFRDAWFGAQQNYNNMKSSADLTDDPIMKKQWTYVDEPALRAKIDELEKQWVAKGYKMQVEDAQRIIAALGSKSPQQTWAEWMNYFNDSIDLKTSSTGQTYAPTSFAPSNAFNDNAWQEFTLSGDEANKLIDQAPAELQKMLASDQFDLDIESLSFEYSSVVIRRPWLATDLFKARFWKFYESSQSISNGLNPPAGMYPSFVNALVFVRNLQIKLKTTSTNDNAIGTLKAKGGLNLGFFMAAPLTDQPTTQKKIAFYSPIIAKADLVRTATVAESASAKPLISRTMMAAVSADASGEQRYASRIKSKAFLRADIANFTAVKTAVVLEPSPSPPPVAPPVPPVNDGSLRKGSSGPAVEKVQKALIEAGFPLPKFGADGKFGDETESAVRDYQRAHGLTVDGVVGPITMERLEANEFMIMAFICKRVPLSPNPDLTLSW